MPESPNSNLEERNLSRRGLLKALAAAGGALGAAAFLPGKWVKPVVEAGVLPGHAQSTGDNNTLRLVGPLYIYLQGTEAPALNPGSLQYLGEMQYQDDLAQLTKAAAHLIGGTNCQPNITPTVDFVSPERATSGYIGFSFGANLCNGTSTEFCVQLSHAGRLTNSLCGTLTNGVGL